MTPVKAQFNWHFDTKWTKAKRISTFVHFWMQIPEFGWCVHWNRQRQLVSKIKIPDFRKHPSNQDIQGFFYSDVSLKIMSCVFQVFGFLGFQKAWLDGHPDRCEDVAVDSGKHRHASEGCLRKNTTVALPQLTSPNMLQPACQKIKESAMFQILMLLSNQDNNLFASLLSHTEASCPVFFHKK